MLAHTLKRPFPHKMSLWPDTDKLNGGNAVEKGFIDFRRLFLGNLQAERLTENSRQRIQVPNGVPFRNSSPFGILSHGFPPHITHHIVRKVNAGGIRRRRQAFHQIRHLVYGEIGFLRTGHPGTGAKKGNN